VRIANQLGIESLNLAEEATSADQALHKLLNLDTVINWKETLILFCLTGISRSMFITDRPRELYPMDNTPTAIAYYKYIHSKELDWFNRVRNILCAQQYSQQIGSSILFVNNWDPAPVHKAIDQNQFYFQTLTEMLGITHDFDRTILYNKNLRHHQYVFPNGGHPNIAGHDIIAKKLSNWIKEKLNDKSVS